MLDAGAKVEGSSVHWAVGTTLVSRHLDISLLWWLAVSMAAFKGWNFRTVHLQYMLQMSFQVSIFLRPYVYFRMYSMVYSLLEKCCLDRVERERER